MSGLGVKQAQVRSLLSCGNVALFLYQKYLIVPTPLSGRPHLNKFVIFVFYLSILSPWFLLNHVITKIHKPD